MTVTLNRRALAGLVLAIGVIVLAVGLFLGFRNVSTAGVPCGSPFKPLEGGARIAELPSAKADATDDYTVSVLTSAIDDCTDTTNSRKPVAWAATIIGAVVAGVCLFLVLTPSRRSGHD